MTTLLLPGWSQSPEGLVPLATSAEGEVLRLDYHAYPDFRSLCRAVPQDPPHIIGWSLGGQIAARLVAGGHIRTQRLTLLAAPFQFVSGESYEGTPQAVFDGFFQGMKDNPEATHKRFFRMVSSGRSSLPLTMHHTPYPHLLPWLKILGEFSCSTLDFRNFPPTHLIHGTDDAVVPVIQLEYWKEQLPEATVERKEGYGHWPV
jgi:pimeloyl-[acyl-carrier protein] methyl ester esterase